LKRATPNSECLVSVTAAGHFPILKSENWCAQCFSRKAGLP
jgi:hypothetical protein